MNIVNRMFNIMNEKQLKMTALADVLGISKSVVSTWKSRNTNPPIEYMVRICEFLDVSYSFFLTGKEIEPIRILESALNEDENEIIENYKVLDTRGKHKLHTVIYDELDRMNGIQSPKTEEGNAG